MVGKIKVSILTILFINLFTIGVFSSEAQNQYKESSNNFLSFAIRSNSFNSGNEIPAKYVCTNITGGENKSIGLTWTGAPTVTKSFAVIMYDTNLVANNFVHWAVINIPPDESRLKEGVSGTIGMPKGSTELTNSSGKSGYHGPCPPAGTGKHEYKIIVYALKVKELGLSGQVTLSQFEEAVKGNIYSQAEISGYFEQ